MARNKAEGTVQPTPFVPDIRGPIEGFDPAALMIDIPDRANPDQTQKYLNVKYRVAWALLWAKQEGKQIVIDDSSIQFVPECKQVVATCIIYVDGAEATRSSAGKYYDPENLQGSTTTPVQDACTAAKGRALANLGFGTVNCALEEGDVLTPCDAGVTLPSVATNPLLAAASGALTTNEAAPPIKSGSTATSESTSAEEKPKGDKPFIRQKMTLKEAQAFVIKSGQYANQTLGEVYVTNPDYVRWFGEPNNGLRAQMLKSACLTLLEHAESKKAS